jgi:hypothetical protein
MNKDVGFVARHTHPWWAAPGSLAQFAEAPPSAQQLALERIVFKTEARCDIELDRFTIVVSCRFALDESRLWLNLEVTDRFGKTTVTHPFAPWHDFNHGPTRGLVQKVFREIGVRAVKLTVQLDVLGDGNLMHPIPPLTVEGNYQVGLILSGGP